MVTPGLCYPLVTLRILESTPADQLRQRQTNVFMVSGEEQSAQNLWQMLTWSRIINIMMTDLLTLSNLEQNDSLTLTLTSCRPSKCKFKRFDGVLQE